MADVPNESPTDAPIQTPKITVNSASDNISNTESVSEKGTGDNADSESNHINTPGEPSCSIKTDNSVKDQKRGILWSSGAPSLFRQQQDSAMSDTRSTASLRASFLRPSQFSSAEKFGSSALFGENSSNRSSFPLKPARLGNPFAKSFEERDDSESTEKNHATPTFVPLGSPIPSQSRTNPVPAPQNSSSTSSGFVFGQNLHERVTETSAEEKKDVQDTVNNGASCSNFMLASNGTTENLFTTVLKQEHGDKSNDNSKEVPAERPSKSLSEAAREYEESRAVKRKYEEVAIVTGEEDEENVLQINCKLFAYDKVKATWVERGRGNLRLNDKDAGGGQKQSRVIMRATGSLRVVLNTKLWPGMIVTKASAKGVRLTAMDANGDIVVFLVMATPKEADQLFAYLDSRVATLRASATEGTAPLGNALRSSNTSNTCDESSVKKRATMDPHPSHNQEESQFTESKTDGGSCTAISVGTDKNEEKSAEET